MIKIIRQTGQVYVNVHQINSSDTQLCECTQSVLRQWDLRAARDSIGRLNKLSCLGCNGPSCLSLKPAAPPAYYSLHPVSHRCSSIILVKSNPMWNVCLSRIDEPVADGLLFLLNYPIGWDQSYGYFDLPSIVSFTACLLASSRGFLYLTQHSRPPPRVRFWTHGPVCVCRMTPGPPFPSPRICSTGADLSCHFHKQSRFPEAGHSWSHDLITSWTLMRGMHSPFSGLDGPRSGNSALW